LPNRCEIWSRSAGKQQRSVVSALDEQRFGSQRTLNLRENLPTAADAVRRAESWLREHQVRGSVEVLIITGRGIHSAEGVAVIRPAVEKLLFSLRRQGVIASHHEHNPGAFAVQLAPLRSLLSAPPRRREPRRPESLATELPGLTRETTDLLRTLAEHSLEALGVSPNEASVADEMHRHLQRIAPALPGGPQMEEELRSVLRATIAEYD
jgi:hypothetical protein